MDANFFSNCDLITSLQVIFNEKFPIMDNKFYFIQHENFVSWIILIEKFWRLYLIKGCRKKENVMLF